jgi:hypothetical protein
MEINPYELPRPAPSPCCSGRLPVRVTGILTAEDAIHALQSLGVGRKWRRILVCCGSAGVAAGLFVAVVFHYQVVGILIALTSFFSIENALFAWKRNLRNAWGGRDDYKHPVTWSFCEDALRVETIRHNEQYHWNNVVDLRVTHNQVAIMGKQANSPVLVFVPRRFFDAEEDWAAVCQLIAHKVVVRQGGTVGG